MACFGRVHSYLQFGHHSSSQISFQSVPAWLRCAMMSKQRNGNSPNHVPLFMKARFQALRPFPFPYKIHRRKCKRPCQICVWINRHTQSFKPRPLRVRTINSPTMHVALASFLCCSIPRAGQRKTHTTKTWIGQLLSWILIGRIARHNLESGFAYESNKSNYLPTIFGCVMFTYNGASLKCKCNGTQPLQALILVKDNCWTYEFV